MGIVNATPDSFSDPGNHDPGELAERGRALAAAGAAVIDVGGESGRTDREAVPEAVEAARVVPVVERLAADGLTVSVDTWRAHVARAALEAGAQMVNDPSGLYEPEVADACAEHGASLVLTHTRVPPKQKGYPAHGDVMADVRQLLGERDAQARERGVEAGRIVLDPGIDMGKTPAESIELLRRLHELSDLERPVLVAISRKDFIGALLGRAPARPRRRDAGRARGRGHRRGRVRARARRGRGGRLPDRARGDARRAAGGGRSAAWPRSCAASPRRALSRPLASRCTLR